MTFRGWITSGLCMLAALLATAPASASQPASRTVAAEMKLLLERGAAAEAVRLGETALNGTHNGMKEPAAAQIIPLQAEAYIRLGLLRNAAHTVTARIDAITPADSGELPQLLNLLGQTAILGGRLDEAEKTIDKAAALLHERSQPDQVWLLILKTHLRYRQKKNADALKLSREAETAAETLNDNLLKGFILMQRAHIHRQSGDLPQAVTAYTRALDNYYTLGDTHDAIYGIIATATGMARLQLSPATERAKLLATGMNALERAADASRRTANQRALAHSLGKMGELLEQEGKLDDALGKTLLAMHQAQQARLSDQTYLWQYQAARILKKQHNMPRALDMYRLSAQNLNRFKKGLAPECGIADGSFQETTKPIYLELTELLIDRAEQSAPPEETQRLLLEARATIESLRTEELRDYFEDACLGSDRAGRGTHADVPPHTALIYTIMLPGRTELLVTLPDGIKRFKAAETSATISREIRLLRMTIENRFPAWVTSSRKLYDWLIRPLEADLKRHDITTIVFVPDGPLRNIPLTVLNDGSRSMIEKYAVATIQGLSFASSPSTGGDKPAGMMMAGLSESVQGYPALSNVTAEVKGIRDAYPGVSLINSEFQVQKVKEQLDLMPYPLIHIASHGEFTGNARNNYILTWDGKMTLDHLDRFIRNSASRKTPVELLSLSACKTAAGDDRASLGLAGLAVKSGARTAVASLWDIDDKSTSELFIEFYHIIKETGGINRAEALRRAQLAIRSRYDHPYFWSPFLLIGSWL